MKSILSVLVLATTLVACDTNNKQNNTIQEPQKTTVEVKLTNKEKAVALIESLETGAKEPISYINPTKYIQHNLSVGDGLAGFGAVVANAPEGGFKAKVVRVCISSYEV